MNKESIFIYYTRDLPKVGQEIVAFKTEENIWKTSGAISNSAGNLCLHLIGNLNTFIGQQLGNTGYIRNRDLEFSAKDVARNDLMEQWQNTSKVVLETLNKISEEALLKPFPIIIWDKEYSIGYTLIQLAIHLNYHLGQMNYVRRMLEG